MEIRIDIWDHYFHTFPHPHHFRRKVPMELMPTLLFARSTVLLRSKERGHVSKCSLKVLSVFFKCESSSFLPRPQSFPCPLLSNAKLKTFTFIPGLFYGLTPALCFSLYYLLCGTSCWITWENLFWAILCLLHASLTSQVLLLPWLLNFPMLSISQVTWNIFAYFSVSEKENCCYQWKSISSPLALFLLSLLGIFKIVYHLLFSSVPIV